MTTNALTGKNLANKQGGLSPPVVFYLYYFLWLFRWRSLNFENRITMVGRDGRPGPEGHEGHSRRVPKNRWVVRVPRFGVNTYGRDAVQLTDNFVSTFLYARFFWRPACPYNRVSYKKQGKKHYYDNCKMFNVRKILHRRKKNRKSNVRYPHLTFAFGRQM